MGMNRSRNPESILGDALALEETRQNGRDGVGNELVKICVSEARDHAYALRDSRLRDGAAGDSAALGGVTFSMVLEPLWEREAALRRP